MYKNAYTKTKHATFIAFMQNSTHPKIIQGSCPKIIICWFWVLTSTYTTAKLIKNVFHATKNVCHKQNY